MGSHATGQEALLWQARALPWLALAGYAAPAALWESDFFSARLSGYGPETLDREIAAGRLLWYGAGPERIGFCAPEDLDLILETANSDDSNGFDLEGPPGFWDSPRDFWEIKDALGLDIPSCAQKLWDYAWKGLLSADTFEALRRGLERGFIPKGSEENPMSAGNGVQAEWGRPLAGYRSLRRRQVPRALREKWRSGPPILGRWFSLADDAGGLADPLEEEELNRDRVRLLLNRWGVLARPLLEREEANLSWGRLLPAIRRLELSGELVAGRFFQGINSLQFASPSIEKELEAAQAEQGVYWMNAVDPASPAGLDIEGLWNPKVPGNLQVPQLPARAAVSRLCFRGSELIALSLRSGRELRVFIDAEDRDILSALAFTGVPRSGPGSSRKKIQINTVNGASAASSPYAGALKSLGFLPDRGMLILW
jgi:ATP-dependent Lhr-like helicase